MIVTVRGGVVLLAMLVGGSGGGVGAVYLIAESCWACSRAEGLGVVRRSPHVSINVSRISWSVLACAYVDEWKVFRLQLLELLLDTDIFFWICDRFFNASEKKLEDARSISCWW